MVALDDSKRVEVRVKYVPLFVYSLVSKARKVKVVTIGLSI